MDDLDSVINNNVCKFYPGDLHNCVKYIPISKIKLVGSMLIIIIGILIFKKSNGLIIKFISNFLNKFAKLVGITLIFVGLLMLNNSVDSLVL
jgi:hypothetical protein